MNGNPSGFSLRSLRRRWRAAFLAYLLIALAGLPTDNHEIFPFFAWILFPTTPNTITQYHLQEVGSPTDTFFKPAPGSGNPIDFYASVQRIGKSSEAARSNEAEAAWEFLERNYLPPGSYELIRLEMDPAHYYRTGEAARSVIGRRTHETGVDP